MRNTSMQVLRWDRPDRRCQLPRFPSVSHHPPGARSLGERKDVVRGKRVTGRESQQVGGLQEGYWRVRTEDRHAKRFYTRKASNWSLESDRVFHAEYDQGHIGERMIEKTVWVCGAWAGYGALDGSPRKKGFGGYVAATGSPSSAVESQGGAGKAWDWRRKDITPMLRKTYRAWWSLSFGGMEVESAEVERFNSTVSTPKGEDGWMTCVVVQIASLEACEVGTGGVSPSIGALDTPADDDPQRLGSNWVNGFKSGVKQEDEKIKNETGKRQIGRKDDSERDD
ncbi:hypothetical protein DFH08DRAFT_823552 [Mycena albidolilacea]|uniref:Uncharacterized protein n=1 Tax=Mycena albidolilacea TaxID=1033008 RepID=A0AAD6Z754_9AGAR|nr:hypothetical protein DFH08DRAFT_823552 [Mycena albidolilacea]